MWRAAAILLAATAPALAEDAAPAPDYFVTTVMETSTAQQLAVSCPTLSVHLGRMAERTEAVLAQLTEEGFAPENLLARMEDPADRIAILQNLFMDKHGLKEDGSTTAVCAAGQAEIAEGTGIGALLIGVAE